MSRPRPSDVLEAKWSDWRWQLNQTIRHADDLPANLVGNNREAILKASDQFKIAITPYYLSLIDPKNPNDPIRRMAVPSPMELSESPRLFNDPISEEVHSPLPGVIRRYPDRAVLLVSGRCAVNCRHCTRRHLGSGRIAPLSKPDLESAIQYLKNHREISDVILTGGDPLLLSNSRLEEILFAVRDIPSVEIIRIGTRVPVTLPMRITNELVNSLAQFHPLYLNTQFNHPKELTPAAKDAITKLANRGIQVANQAVLLKGVNDSPQIIEELCRNLLKYRVRPYYLFFCDLWKGTGHFRTSLNVGIEIMAHLRGRLSGLGIPQLVIDLPGGSGKIPLLPNHIIKKGDGHTLIRGLNGEVVIYPDP